MKKSLFTTAILAILLSATAVAQEKTYQLSSHILDINLGQPAPGVLISLSRMNDDHSWSLIEERTTDSNGRVKDFLETTPGTTRTGIYKLTYHVSPYFQAHNQSSFYPFIEVVFEIKDSNHYHVPITLSPFGYSTYRGS